MHRLAKNRGFSALEVLVVLAVLIPVLLELTSTINHSRVLLTKIRVTQEALQNDAKIRVLISKVIRDVDSHTLILLPRIQPRGKITFADGSENPVMHGETQRRPKSNSSALTYLSIAGTDVMRVSVSKVLGRGLRALACPLFRQETPAPTKDLLLVGPEIFFEVEIMKQSSRAGGCSEFKLSYQEGMTGQPINPELISSALKTSYLIYPVQEHYTVYVDKTGTLRYLQHAGRSNIENQPIARGIEALNLKLLPPSGDFRNYTIETSGRMSSGGSFSFSLGNSIPRLTSENIFFFANEAAKS